MEDLQEWNDMKLALSEDVQQTPWRQFIDEPWMKGWQKSVSNDPAIHVRTWGTATEIPSSNAHDQYQTLWEAAIGDDTIQEVEILEEDKSKPMAVFRYVIQSPTRLISNRDVIARLSVKEQWPDATSTGIMIRSVEHPKYPPDAKSKLIRAKTNQVWVLKKNEENHNFEISTSVRNDIGGSIPKWITKKFAGRMTRGIYERLNKTRSKL